MQKKQNKRSAIEHENKTFKQQPTNYLKIAVWSMNNHAKQMVSKTLEKEYTLLSVHIQVIRSRTASIHSTPQISLTFESVTATCFRSISLYVKGNDQTAYGCIYNSVVFILIFCLF